MLTSEPLRKCPQCKTDLEEANAALRNITELSFCLECQFPLLLVAGKYRFSKLLAQGGFGKVYLVRHIHLDREPERVIKVLDPDIFAIKGMEARFRREVQVTGALSQLNEHIVRIYDDFGEIPKLGHFYVMEHLQGQPLTSLIRNPKKLPSLKLCFHIFSQLCNAMIGAHEEEVVHRDLKPDNIFLIERKGDPYFVKVLDFGIAKPMDFEALESTQVTQGTLGTPPYMSPEQCNDEPLDHRSDIYAMGVIFYELLVGHTPFYKKDSPRSALRILQDHLLTEPPSVRELRPDRMIPQAVEDVIMMALAKHPDDRFRSVRHFQRELAGAYLDSDIGLPKSPDEIEKRHWTSRKQSADFDSSNEPIPTQSGPAWPVADSTSFSRDKLREMDGLEEAYAPIDSEALHLRLHSKNAVSTGEQLQDRHALQQSQAAQSNTDQHPINKDLPDNSRAIHRDSAINAAVPEGFVSYDSGRYEIGCLGDDSDDDSGSFDEYDAYESQFLIQKTIRPLLLLLAILLGAGVWGLLIVSSWNEHEQTAAQILPEAGAVCGNALSSWRKGAVRLLFIPLLSRNAVIPLKPAPAKRIKQLLMLQKRNLEGIKKVTGILGRDFLSIHESLLGFDQPDPKLNHARALMYGKLCHADVVFSGGWLTASSSPQGASDAPKKETKTTMAWLRLFATFTGSPLTAHILKKKIKLGQPYDIDELIRTNALALPGPRTRDFLKGLVSLRAANHTFRSAHLSPFLVRKAFEAFRRARVLNPSQLPIVKKMSLGSLPRREEVLIQTGPFWMGPAKKATKQELPSYWMDRYEVSREAYAVCVLSGRCPAIRNFLESSWQLPRDRVTAKAATAFCKTEGKDLPTKEQWVKAARGGLEINGKPNPFPKRKYPWGNQAYTCKYVHVLRCYRALIEGDLVGVMISVKRKLRGMSPYGIYHMLGNANELIKDGTIKGGDGYGPIKDISWKIHMDQRSGLSWVGFRCARNAR